MAANMRALLRAAPSIARDLPRQCGFLSRSSTATCSFSTATRMVRQRCSLRPRPKQILSRAYNGGFLSTRTYAGCACSAAAAAAQPRRKRTAYIALGSNLGDRVAEIEKACREMDARGVKVKRTSSLWETEPMYVMNQDRFLNGACEVSLPRFKLEETVKLIYVARLRRIWSLWPFSMFFRALRMIWDA